MTSTCARTVWWRASVAIFAVALASCTNANESTSSTTPSPQSSTGGPSRPDSTNPAKPPPDDGATTTTRLSTPSTEPTSPLDAFFGNTMTIGSSSPEDDAKIERELQANQDALARCMNEEGFDYVPYVIPYRFTWQGRGATIVSAQTPGSSLPADQFAKQYGYGISTMDDSTNKQQTNPNDAIVDAMSAAERVAYYHALYGPDVALQKDGRVAHKELTIGDSSCYQKASNEAFGDPTTATTNPVMNAFGPLLEAMGALTQRELADPRMVAAMQEWIDCMATAGYPGYTDLNQPRQDVSDRTTKVMGSAKDASKADPDELAAVRAFEIAVATADLECHVSFDATFRTVQIDVEQAFVDAHRAELEQYRDAVAASSAGG